MADILDTLKKVFVKENADGETEINTQGSIATIGMAAIGGIIGSFFGGFGAFIGAALLGGLGVAVGASMGIKSESTEKLDKANSVLKSQGADGLDNTKLSLQAEKQQAEQIQKNILKEAESFAEEYTEISEPLNTTKTILINQIDAYNSNLNHHSKDAGKILNDTNKAIVGNTDNVPLSSIFEQTEVAMMNRYNQLKQSLDVIDHRWTANLGYVNFSPWGDKTDVDSVVKTGMGHLNNGNYALAKSQADYLEKTYLNSTKLWEPEALDHASKFVEFMKLRDLQENITNLKISCTTECKERLDKIKSDLKIVAENEKAEALKAKEQKAKTEAASTNEATVAPEAATAVTETKPLKPIADRLLEGILPVESNPSNGKPSAKPEVNVEASKSVPSITDNSAFDAMLKQDVKLTKQGNPNAHLPLGDRVTAGISSIS